MRTIVSRTLIAVVLMAGGWSMARAQGGPPPPPPPLPPPLVPGANPITEEKRALGKILFWEEQLSGDSTVACGTCHGMGRSGTDPRTNPFAINPGIDGNFATNPDNIRSSFGVVHADALGHPVADPVFGFDRQVTRRAANAAIMAAYSPEVFWDGRAGQTFFNPETGALSIANGAALENQAIGPVLSVVEMGNESRTWSQVAAKLALSEPLGTATSVPADVFPLIAAHKSYPDLFQEAFGDPAITAERIAFAIATYERTLVPNQSPYDVWASGVPAGETGSVTISQRDAFNRFRGSPCAACHTPPLFTNNTFRNIGVRPPGEDTGRQEVSLLIQDRGKFKVPTLRGVGLKTTFMHNGVFSNLNQVITHYAPGNQFPDNRDPLLPVPVAPQDVDPLIDFMANGLTDPRVRDQVFPFDQPTVHGGALPQLDFGGDKSTLRWPSLVGVPAYVLYRGNLDELVDADHDGLPDLGYGQCITDTDPNPADGTFVDSQIPDAGRGYFYLKGVRDGGIVRGLGVTSAAKLRVPAVSCP